jgi:integrase
MAVVKSNPPLMRLPKLVAFLNSVERNSIGSKNAYFSGLRHLNNFISRNYSNYDCETILQPILKNKINIYEFFERFISYLLETRIGITPKSISLYVTALRSYFAYYDIDVIPAKFRRKVRMPKIYREDEEPIDGSDVRKLLLSCNNRRLKTLILVLASGGMRVGEALATRNMDLDLSVSPAKVHIRKEYSKTRVARDVYISEEATSYVKQWLDWKYKNPDRERKFKPEDLVFTVYQSKNPLGLYTKIWHEFDKLLKIVNMDEKKEGGINNRKKITLHSFRRFVKTVISNQVSQDYSEWFLGHSKSPYWTLKEANRREIYATKCMKYLTFLDYSILEATGKNIESKLVEKDEQIKSMKFKYDEDIALLKDAVTDMQRLLKNPQKLQEIVS